MVSEVRRYFMPPKQGYPFSPKQVGSFFEFPVTSHMTVSWSGMHLIHVWVCVCVYVNVYVYVYEYVCICKIINYICFCLATPASYSYTKKTHRLGIQR